ncbi:MSP (Major sperm protein) domain-containing protein [Ditylenchus destructor]|uniref:MSP (Major sperm protein) domain-containing protein n=1 Tax=Ditylenchus destructor TaxID=166010 RepID=A0AAD4QWB8_9BILA|nr:MSP (Major sperm protein) domain-containing protein [Ditylenchus destructor]
MEFHCSIYRIWTVGPHLNNAHYRLKAVWSSENQSICPSITRQRTQCTEQHSVCFALSRSNRSSALCSKSVFSQATMSLAVDPAAVQLPASGGVSTHQLNNGGESRLAFKVKSTNNDHYRPLFVPRDVAADGPPKDDKLVIQYLEVGADVTDATELFKTGAPKEVTLPASAQ